MYKKRQTKIRETEHFKETTIQIHRTNEQWIGTDDIQNLYNSMLQHKPDAKIRIRALGATRWTTLADYKNGLTIQDNADYWSGKVDDDEEKFSKFGVVQMTVMISK